jgi:hypothetical protein
MEFPHPTPNFCFGPERGQINPLNIGGYLVWRLSEHRKGIQVGLYLIGQINLNRVIRRLRLHNQ